MTLNSFQITVSLKCEIVRDNLKQSGLSQLTTLDNRGEDRLTYKQSPAHILWMMRYSAAKANTKSIVVTATAAGQRTPHKYFALLVPGYSRT